MQIKVPRSINDLIDLQDRKRWRECRNPTGVLGTLGEYAAALDLLAQGFEPYLPLPGRGIAHYDLIAFDPKSGELFPVSVKTSSSKDGGVSGDDPALQEGALVARVHYTIPGMLKVGDPKERATVSGMMRFISDAMKGRIFFRSEECVNWGAGCGIGRRTVERWLSLLEADGKLDRLKRGHYRPTNSFASSDISPVEFDSEGQAPPEI